MLVLNRKLMEKLFIGDDICVTVVRLERGQVRLGIEAPRDVSIVRAELIATPGHAGQGRMTETNRTDHARSPSSADPVARKSRWLRLR
jgi:carbon storage regulator CsrA